MSNSGFSIKVKMNKTSQIIKAHGLDENGRVTKFTRDVVDRFCDAYVPMNTGIGKNTKTYPNNHSIKYTQPYMHYIYKGKKAVGASKPKGIRRKISNQPLKYQGAPKRGAEWNKRMMNDRGKEVCKNIENFIKNGGK